MLVVVGSPSARIAGPGDLAAAGSASEIARHAALAGGAVQLVGRVGDDPAGDAVLLDLAAHGVGHVAVLRSAGASTPLATPGAIDGADDEIAAAALEEPATPPETTAGGLPIDAADLELALRYLPDYRVIVVASGLDAPAMATVVAAAGWSGARLVVLDDGAAATDALPPDATVLAQPLEADTAFAAVVARYAVELDRGTEPGAAFAAASSAVGWQPVEA
jgi:hypothetical protein